MKLSSKLILLVILPLIACVSVNGQKKRKKKKETTSYVNFDEHRPVFPSFSTDSLMARDTTIGDTLYIEDQGYFMANSHFGDSLAVLMDTLAKLNNSVPFYGYRIVLYTGSDRKRAIFERGRALKLLGATDTKVYMNYQRPYFKVKVGNFYNRITAYATYKMLKAQIPTALLVPDVIDLDLIQFK